MSDTKFSQNIVHIRNIFRAIKRATLLSTIRPHFLIDFHTYDVIRNRNYTLQRSFYSFTLNNMSLHHIVGPTTKTAHFKSVTLLHYLITAQLQCVCGLPEMSTFAAYQCKT